MKFTAYGLMITVYSYSLRAAVLGIAKHRKTGSFGQQSLPKSGRFQRLQVDVDDGTWMASLRDTVCKS